MEALDFQTSLIKGFTAFETMLNGQKVPPIHDIRRQAMTRFAELGFPTVRHEEWKYTSLVAAIKHDYKLPSQAASTLTAAEIAPFLIPELDAQTLVFVNGVFAPELSMIHIQKGVTVRSLAEAFHDKHPLVEKHFAKVASFEKDALVALNTAYALNGVFIELERGVVAERPFHLVFVNDTRMSSVFTPVRNLFVLGENAEATVLDNSHTLTASKNDQPHYGFTSSVTEIVLGENAHLHHYKLQNDVEASYYVGATSVHQESTSVYNSVVITLSGGIVRNNLSSVLAGKAADAHYYGLYCVNGKTLVDNHTLVDHAVAHCTSNELYKGIMDDRSTGVFNGKIMVREDAQKTLAYQSNRNILLSNNATINTKPQLEIFADDVKCSHGCTTGQLDEESLFYLRARGLDKEQARALLLTAFAGEILEKISLEPLRDRLEAIIAERLHQELA
ncbi:MAG: Fe-S cluster assembly protein SufD [Candidatus Kapaibacterium sp.]|nr:MAG: Fe-S cluster assembly protein SufD [Candidatus Kapabacteria bacterium]